MRLLTLPMHVWCMTVGGCQEVGLHVVACTLVSLCLIWCGKKVGNGLAASAVESVKRVGKVLGAWTLGFLAFFVLFLVAESGV